MKILICISNAPDTTTKIAFTEGNTKFDNSNVQYIINPYDEWYALVRGLELKEAAGAGQVTVVSVGGADLDPILRKALAIGADDAVRIDVDPIDAYAVAEEIANFAKDGGYDMILCGKETINYNGGVVPGMIAEFMGLPYVSQGTKLDVTAGVATIERDVQGGSEVLEISGPFVLSASKGMAEQRIPNMRGIMAARTKPLNLVASSAMGSLTKVVEYELPPAKGSCKMIDAENAADLVELLTKEAKVL